MAHLKKNWTGEKIGDLEILDEFSAPYCSKTGRKRKTLRKLRYRCKCGEICETFKGNILYKKTTKCVNCANSNIEIGKKYGQLIVLSRCKIDPALPNFRAYECLCECGDKYIARSHYLYHGKNPKCKKCQFPKRFSEKHVKTFKEAQRETAYKKHLKARQKYIGNKFGNIKVIAFERWEMLKTRRKALYKCKCKCGKHFSVRSDYITKVVSCGCIPKTINIRGGNHPRSKFSDKEVAEMRSLYLTGIYLQKEIAAIYGITGENIYAILRNKNYFDPEYIPPNKINKYPLIGKKMAFLTIESWNKEKYAYNCKCDCGEYRVVDTSALKRGTTRSCGCQTFKRHEDKAKNLIGQKFQKLTCIGITKKEGTQKNILICQCECGNKTELVIHHWKETKSCGCLMGKGLKDYHRSIASNTPKQERRKKSQEPQPLLLLPHLPDPRQLEFDLQEPCSHKEEDKS